MIWLLTKGQLKVAFSSILYKTASQNRNRTRAHDLTNQEHYNSSDKARPIHWPDPRGATSIPSSILLLQHQRPSPGLNLLLSDTFPPTSTPDARANSEYHFMRWKWVKMMARLHTIHSSSCHQRIRVKSMRIIRPVSRQPLPPPPSKKNSLCRVARPLVCPRHQAEQRLSGEKFIIRCHRRAQVSLGSFSIAEHLLTSDHVNNTNTFWRQSTKCFSSGRQGRTVYWLWSPSFSEAQNRTVSE